MAINTSINVTAFIQYLRSKLQNPNVGTSSSSPAYRIDGAAKLEVAEDDSRIMVDASGKTLASLFVVWGPCTGRLITPSTFLQEYDQRLIVIACLDNTQDRTGKYGQALVPIVKQDLFNCLLNKRFDEDCFPMYFTKDEMLKMDKARYWHRYEFSLVGRLQPADGAPLDLSEFDTFTANFNSENPTADNPMASLQIKNEFYQTGVSIPPADNKE